MAENPYAAPSSDLDPPTGGRGEIDIGVCLTQAWSLTWSHFPLWLGVMLVALLISIASVAALCIGVLFVLPVLYWGNALFYLRMHDGGADFNDLFAGFKNYGTVLGTMLVLGILWILVAVPGEIVGWIGQGLEEPVFILVGFLISIGWNAGIMSRLYLSPYFVVDRDYGAIESIKASWEVTGTQKLNVVLLWLMMNVLIIVGFFALCIGVFPAMNMASLMWVTAYRQLTGDGPRDAD